MLVSAVSAAKGTPPLHSGANDDPCSSVAPRSCGCRCTQPCSSTKSCANSTSRFLEHEHPHGSADRLRNQNQNHNQNQTHHPSYWSRCSTSGQPSDPAACPRVRIIRTTTVPPAPRPLPPCISSHALGVAFDPISHSSSLDARPFGSVQHL